MRPQYLDRTLVLPHTVAYITTTHTYTLLLLGAHLVAQAVEALVEAVPMPARFGQEAEGVQALGLQFVHNYFIIIFVELE